MPGVYAGRSGRPWRRACARLRREAPSVCWICGKPIDQLLPYTHPMSWTADHVVPRKIMIANDLDPNDVENLRPAHRTCNSRKGAGKPPIRPNTSRRW
ncbi:HNH endonuclease [Nocardiopsis gilva YIM 90087]|uniref:HNH endonuclease n=2 Tax=Nocardiopsis gilva TaxID=280236 RepID=A0A223S049_9ACTN|nr:HNH endonuclease [Nocardiopsis gilva YIM 90087]